MARQAYDLVHAHWIVPNAVVLGRLAAPLAIGLHGSDVFLAERAGLRIAARRALDRATLLTGCSPELVERICRLGFPAERARTIPYGVDTEKFRPDPARRGIWRQRLGVPAGAQLLGTVGRMASKKGFHVLVEALPGLLRRHASLHVVFAGDGDRLGEFRAALAGWADRVHFPGLVLQDTLPDLYRALDLFVLPAVHDDKGNVDGLPNVILEAMASGLPVVATSISGIPLAVVDGLTGALTPEKDPPALLEVLSARLASPTTLAEMGRAARRKVESELTWDAVAARYDEAYRWALANPRQR
jgi:glycosyltransferase involved in cell wall biosynthesis